MKPNFEFIAFTQKDIDAFTSKREGETKLGECVKVGLESDAKYIVIGICEDIGPQANHGNSGAKNGFTPALTKLLNMQSNRRYNGQNMAIGGYIQQNCSFTSIENARQLVEELDILVASVIAPIFNKNQTPIVIGGGHNNAYPILKAYSSIKQTALEVVNLDPHADCRPLEGRHSGNPFSYAQKDGFLSFYTVLGLHSAYNSETILNYLNEKGFYYSYFEEYLILPEKLDSDLQTLIIRSNEPLGIELDLDSIKFIPSSAYTPSGMSVELARKFIMRLASSKRPAAYLHLPEAAPNNTNEEKITSKTIAYLIHDFVATSK